MERDVFQAWNPNQGFICECGAICDSENNTMVLASGDRIIRWCDSCGYAECGWIDPFGPTDVDAIADQLEHPDPALRLFNNFVFSRGYL